MNNKVKPPCKVVFISYNKQTKELDLYHACFTKLKSTYATWAPFEIENIFNIKCCCLCGSENIEFVKEKEVRDLFNE